MDVSAVRMRAIFRKEIREYRRNRIIVVTMVILPAVFVAIPIIVLFAPSSSVTTTHLDSSIGAQLLFLLVVPAIMPSTIAAYAVVGEREQATLEPMLSTPIRSEEFLIAKALAVFLPTVVISYAGFCTYLVCALFASTNVRMAVFGSSHLLILLLFTPLLAGWTIWVGIAISARTSDVRVSQQLGTLASFPPLVVTALISLNVIRQTLLLTIGLALALLLFDGLGWQLVSAMFNRERLVAGTR